MTTRLENLSEEGNEINDEGLFARPLHHQLTPGPVTSGATTFSADPPQVNSNSRLNYVLPTLSQLDVTARPPSQTPAYSLPRITKGMHPDALKSALEERRRNALIRHMGSIYAPYKPSPPISIHNPRPAYDANPKGDPRLLLDLLSPNCITFHNILNRLSITEVVTLSKVCKGLRNIQQSYYPISSHLLRYVDDPLQFCNMMNVTGAIVAGTGALGYITKNNNLANDLNVFVEGEEDVLKWARYLETEEWYAFTPATWQPTEVEEAVQFTFTGGARIECMKDHYNSGTLSQDQKREMESNSMHREDWMLMKNMTETLRYSDGMLGFHLFTHRTSRRRINVIMSRSEPLYRLLRGVGSTAGLSFYTANKFYCLFPYFTMNQGCQYRLNQTSTRRSMGAGITPLSSDASVEKYMRLGWHLGNTEGEPKGLEAKLFPIRHHRRVGDKYTWIIPFDTEGINAAEAKISEEVFEMTTFNIYCTSSETRSPNSYNITCRSFASPSLKHSYIMDGVHLLDPEDWKSRRKMLEPGNWGKFLKWKLEGYVDVEKFINSGSGSGGGGCGFQYDAQMEMLYRVWREGQGGIDGDQIPEWIAPGRY